VPLRVPLEADRVDAPQLRWGRGPYALGGHEPTALVFSLQEEDSLGRVTFEELDAIRASRGEYEPYEGSPGWEASDWVYLVENSRWLMERHRYESGHYDWPLTDFDHYLFRFHDDFVEAIARGIWLDRPDAARPFAPPATHPLHELPPDTVVERARSEGFCWELRANPTPVDELLEASRLCSQRLFQYNLILGGRNVEDASVWLRTRRGLSVSTLASGFLRMTRYDAAGIATSQTFAERWTQRVEELAEHRRKRGVWHPLRRLRSRRPPR
jgi:hypothetical protein